MTMHEFQLRRHGYQRQTEHEWARTRKIGFAALVGSHMNPKRLPKRESDFLRLPTYDSVGGATETQVERFKEAMKKYIARKKVG